MFEIGKPYTRNEINQELGGSIMSYLPTVDGVVVAGCFNQDRKNPDAPNIILPGLGPIIENTAELFTIQGNAIPIFIKKKANCWEYVGNYKVRRHSFDKEEIRKHALKANRVDDLSSVLFLEKVST